MGKRCLKQITVIVCLILVSLMATYLGLAVYYHNAFEYGTWINGVYCTGRSIEEVNKELTSDFVYEGITVTDKDGNTCTIAAENIAYEYDFAKALEIFLQQQNSFMWIESLFHSQVVDLIPVVSYDEAALELYIDEIPFLQSTQADSDEEREIAIIRTEHGYELLNEREDVLETDEAEAAIREALSQSQTTLSLKEKGCYHDLELTQDMKETLELWEKVEQFQSCGIKYRMGEELVPVDASVVSEWILLDENGQFALDAEGMLQIKENAVEEFVQKLAEEYDTVGSSRQFSATSGRTVTVSGGTYGNKLDQKAETEYLKKAFAEGKKEIHEPIYQQKGCRQGKEDIGDTYVEVDMGEQMMYYYENGNLLLETPVVTGNTSLRRGTPEGVNYVYLKQKNRILRGPGYASHVDYWMPVNGGIGIHDSSWRSKYGGTIYQTNGSHGCINTPGEIMEQLYELVDVGTPVVMFY